MTDNGKNNVGKGGGTTCFCYVMLGRGSSLILRIVTEDGEGLEISVTYKVNDLLHCR